MQIISRAAHNTLRLLTPASLEALYAKLKSELPADMLTFFALPERKNSEMVWYAFHPHPPLFFSSLSEQDQDAVIDYIEARKKAISTIINNIPELKSWSEVLFMVPSPQHIFIFKDTNGEYSVTLAQWACSSISTKSEQNPLAILINRPRFDRSKVIIKTLYSDGSIAPDYPFVWQYLEIRKEIKSDREGLKDLGNLRNGTTFSIQGGGQAADTKIDFLVKENQAYYEAVFPFFTSLTVEVTDHLGNPQHEVSVRIRHIDRTISGTTDDTGIARFSAVEADVDIQVEVPDAQHSPLTYRVKHSDNHLRVELRAPEMPVEEIPEAEKLVYVQLVDHLKQPIPDARLNIVTRSTQVEELTDSAGKIELKESLFEDGEKVKVKINLTEDTKNNSHSKTFKYRSPQKEYILQLHKRRAWWWWLLLLLPLLLLIKCEKEVWVQPVYGEHGQVLPGYAVQMTYNSTFLYSDGQFFKPEPINLIQNTGQDGIARFEHVQYSVYSYIFKWFSSAQFSVDTLCFSNDSITVRFHGITNQSPVLLHLSPSMIALDIKVIDKSDSEPLPGANISISTEYLGEVFSDSATTDANGVALVATFPQCGKVIKLTGSLEGYSSDSISNVSVEQLHGDIGSKRTLKLKPVKEKITFFVKNCKNGQPIPDAKATISLEYPDGKKKSRNVRTNVNGLGKGTYDDAHVIAHVVIEAQKRYFKPGKINFNKTVQEFIAMPDSLRTICLEPEENPVDFVNIDANTQKVLAGVKNIITINNAGSIRVDTVMSNSKGVFTIGGLMPDDVLSIRATLPPYYEDNTTTIQQANAIKLLETRPEKRIIPLKPVEVELSFRTVHSRDNSLLPSAELNIIVDGTPYYRNIRSSGSGEFKVNLPYSSTISIIADKIEFEKNDTKVKNQPVSFLLKAAQDARDIPLKPLEIVEQTVSIINHNSKPDESFSLLVNGKPLGVVKHCALEEDISSFKAQFFIKRDNIIELILRENPDCSVSDTGSKISISPVGLSLNYGGKGKSYKFILNIQDSVFKEL